MNIKYAVLLSEGNEFRAINVDIIKEQIPELHVVVSNRENVFTNHLSLFNIEDEYDGIVILEDDVQLCKDFKNKLVAVLEQHPGEVVSFFESACTRGQLHSEHRKGRNFNWCQCNYYPREVAKRLGDPEMLPRFEDYFYSKLNEPWNYPIDRYIPFVLAYYKIDYWMEVPFLVQHLPLKSNFKGRPINRQSKFFIDDVNKNED